MAKPEIKIFDDKPQLADYFANDLLNKIEESRHQDYFTLSLSGGSTPKFIFDHLSLNYSDQIPWERIKFFWGDERCVPPDDKQSNYRMTREHLFAPVGVPQSNVFRIKGEERPDEEALNYAEVLKRELPSKNGIPSLCYLMLGLGDDGHTASVFPGQLHLFKTPGYTAVSQNPYNQQIRITLTGNILNNARNVVFLLTGKGKAEKAATIINRKEGWEKLPASYINPFHGNVRFFMDKDAASLL